jgi:hypothetical protein
MNKVLKDCILEVTMPFLDDIMMKGCLDEEKDESKDNDVCRKTRRMKVLQRLEVTNLIFSDENFAFKQLEILLLCHLCGASAWRPLPYKVNAIEDMEECVSQTNV